MSQPNASEPIYRRILLKLSGEALVGEDRFGIDPEVLLSLAREVAGLAAVGIQVGLVLGGGNIFRGAKLAQAGLGRVTGDHMGMLATLMNALAMQDALEGLGASVRVMSSLPLYPMCEDFSRRRAIRHLEKGRVTIFAGGTGNPLFTTDSAASLRAIEIDAELLIKATKVNGIYSADPVRVPDARFYSRITYDQAIRDNLQVMDTTALVLCRDHRMPLRVMNIYQPGALSRLLYGQDIGSLVASGD